MEQITRRNGDIYYGETRCTSADDAYKRFRIDYNESLGRNVHFRLNRIGKRVERIHGFGFVFAGGTDVLRKRFSHLKRTPCVMMGLMGISYVRSIGIYDYPDIPEEEFEDWLDWVFSRRNGTLKMYRVRDKVGRTSKRLNRRYR